jgi:hypothetical protein
MRSCTWTKAYLSAEWDCSKDSWEPSIWERLHDLICSLLYSPSCPCLVSQQRSSTSTWLSAAVLVLLTPMAR